MALKTLVKVGNISNLSDARYCAGMGVDMLGYTAVPGRDRYIPSLLHQEIRGWISGPSTVVELYGLARAADLAGILEEYQPDYLEGDVALLPLLTGYPPVPLIITIETDADLKKIAGWKDRIRYLQIKESQRQIIQEAGNDYDVLLLLQSGEQIQTILDTLPIRGIALIGSAEIRPGYKEYDDLALVLEQLEE